MQPSNLPGGGCLPSGPWAEGEAKVPQARVENTAVRSVRLGQPMSQNLNKVPLLNHGAFLLEKEKELPSNLDEKGQPGSRRPPTPALPSPRRASQVWAGNAQGELELVLKDAGGQGRLNKSGAKPTGYRGGMQKPGRPPGDRALESSGQKPTSE